VIAFILSLLAKPISVTLPCTLVLIHVLYLVYHPDRRTPAQGMQWCLKRILLPVVPLLVLSAYFCAVTVYAQGPAIAASFPLDLRLINTLLSYVRYLKMFFNPTDLAVFYPFNDDDLKISAAVLALAVLAAISVVTILLARKKPQLLIGWCWYLGTMVPQIGLVQVGSQSHADRYLYIPMIGLAFVFPVLFEELRSLRVWAARAVTGTAVAVLGASMIAATQLQVSYWRDGAALFSHSREVAGDCSTSVLNLSVAYHRMGRYEELLAFANDSRIAAAPLEYRGKLAAIRASGLYYTQQYDAAIATAKQSLHWGGPGIMPCWTLAMAYFDLGRLDKSVLWLGRARAEQKPIKRVFLTEVENDVILTTLERIVKEAISSSRNPPSQMRRTPWGSGPRIEAW
jgi:tetratricopeptide (TPR) repeat protein